MRTSAVVILLGFSILLRAQDSQGIKPGISINGAPCLILNLTASCMPRTCDSIVIANGDSIEFCTYQQIFLNTDTAYWMRWHFFGATNLPDTILNDYPSQTPICYWPRWDSAGTFIVEAFYNGILSAYPGSDCYPFGPSHWYIKVVVLPTPNEIQERNTTNAVRVFPNPGMDIITVETEKVFETAEVYDSAGRMMMQTVSRSIDISALSDGCYFIRVNSGGEICNVPFVIAR